VLLQVEAALIPEQTVGMAHFDVSPVEHRARVPGHDANGDRIWLRLQGRLTVHYTAKVTIRRTCGDLAPLPALPPHMLPGETGQFVLPSRYCPSDKFQNFVKAEFARWLGARVAATRDWVQNHFAYQTRARSTATTALESFVMRQEVRRDFAHVLITLVRASAIPARFASVYAPASSRRTFTLCPRCSSTAPGIPSIRPAWPAARKWPRSVSAVTLPTSRS
jgi:transglutaminase-like putative cysteine protease